LLEIERSRKASKVVASIEEIRHLRYSGSSDLVNELLPRERYEITRLKGEVRNHLTTGRGKRVRMGYPIGRDKIIGEVVNNPRRHDLSNHLSQPFEIDMVFYMGLLQNLNHLLSVMFRDDQ